MLFSSFSYNEYVFVHRLDPGTLNIRIRAPVDGSFRLEVVAKDSSSKEADHNFDWIAIYKIIFEEEIVCRKPFPKCPYWGPGHIASGLGLSPVSHQNGQCKVFSDGKVEIQFKSNNNEDLQRLEFYSELIDGSSR